MDMFNLFRKKILKYLPIKKELEKISKLSSGSYGVAIMIGDQVLFQILQSKHFIQHGFEPKEMNSFVEVHFFNKSKTKTLEFHGRFKDGEINSLFYYYENPKNNHNYIREIGSDFAEIEKISIESIEKIYQVDFKQLSLDLYYN